MMIISFVAFILLKESKKLINVLEVNVLEVFR